MITGLGNQGKKSMWENENKQQPGRSEDVVVFSYCAIGPNGRGNEGGRTRFGQGQCCLLYSMQNFLLGIGWIWRLDLGI